VDRPLDATFIHSRQYPCSISRRVTRRHARPLSAPGTARGGPLSLLAASARPEPPLLRARLLFRRMATRARTAA
jgi:hypothetical protein